MHGVNLGNWLVVERWMNKPLFAGLDAKDELSLMKSKAGVERLKDHRKNFIQESDIRWMAENHVRIIRLPLGYWTIESDDILYVDWLFSMANKYSIKVLLCLHGAPGSQNGYDHSGKKGKARWFYDKSLQIKTTKLLLTLAKRYRHEKMLWGIEILNEPRLSWRNYWILRKFYRQTYRELKKTLRPGVYTVFSDSYAPLLFAGMLRGSKEYPVAMDIHWYSFATWWPKHRTPTQHMKRIKKRRWTLKIIQQFHPVIVGEWSAILPREKVSRTHIKEYEKQYYNIQKDIYKSALAEFYWSYSVAENTSWNFSYVTEKRKK